MYNLLTHSEMVLCAALVTFSCVALLTVLLSVTHTYSTSERTGVRVGDCYTFNVGVDTRSGLYLDEC